MKLYTLILFVLYFLYTNLRPSSFTSFYVPMWFGNWRFGIWQSGRTPAQWRQLLHNFR